MIFHNLIHFIISILFLFQDGTFRLCPKQFAQLYTIVIVHNGFTLPVVYAFLSRMTQVNEINICYDIYGEVKLN